MYQSIILLAALFIGYAIHRLPLTVMGLNKLLDYSVMLILFSLGYGFGVSAAHLWLELAEVAKITGVFVLSIFVFNFASVALFFHFKKSARIDAKDRIANEGFSSYFMPVLTAFKYIILIAMGLLLAIWLRYPIPHDSLLVEILLVVILFIIGHQLRAQGIRLYKLLLNPSGILLALFVIVSSWVAGLIAAKLMGLSLSMGLLYTSSFGWYTLSGILVSHLVSHQAGTTIFFIDVMRELIAIFCIPLLSRWQKEAVVGYCGATAMDFTLPMLKKQMGPSVVSLAITSGMILTVITPVLLPLLSHWVVAVR